MNSTKELGDLNENVDNASITLEPVNGEDEKKKKASGCRCWLVKTVSLTLPTNIPNYKYVLLT